MRGFAGFGRVIDRAWKTKGYFLRDLPSRSVLLLLYEKVCLDGGNAHAGGGNVSPVTDVVRIYIRDVYSRAVVALPRNDSRWSNIGALIVFQTPF